MIIRQIKHIPGAIYSLYADSGFAMAGAVAYSFVLSLFPFCIFVGAVAAYFGGEAFAKQGVAQLFEIAPAPVAEALAPEVMAVMGQQPVRAAHGGCADRPVLRNQRHRKPAGRPQQRLPPEGIALLLPVPAAKLAVRDSQRDRRAGSDLGCGGGARAGGPLQARLPAVAGRLELDCVHRALCDRHRGASARSSWPIISGSQPGDRRLADVWPGVLLSMVLWVLAARLFGSWLNIQRLFALLCGPDADHERAGVLPGFGDHRDPGRRAEPRPHRARSAAGRNSTVTA